jgi:hypothetical protein
MEGNGWSVPCEAEKGAGPPSLEFWIGWAAGQGSTSAEYGECVTLATLTSSHTPSRKTRTRARA